MRRLLLLAVALFGLLWWVRRWLTATLRPPGARGAAGSGVSRQGVMVRDRVCNTFLPRERALATRLGSEEFFFCSERCRDAFLARRREG